MEDRPVGLGSGCGFWQQPDTAPEPAPRKQPPQPIDAVRDKLLGNTVIVAVITDRLLHYDQVLSIRGESRRQVGGTATTAGPPIYPVRDYRSLPDPIASDLGRSRQV